jgi:hypothetical protein
MPGFFTAWAGIIVIGRNLESSNLCLELEDLCFENLGIPIASLDLRTAIDLGYLLIGMRFWQPNLINIAWNIGL